MEPRPATTAEKQELINLMISKFGFEFESFSEIVENSAIAVFDSYTTGCPGYQGKVMMVVWEAGPSIFDVYTWQNGMISLEERG